MIDDIRGKVREAVKALAHQGLNVGTVIIPEKGVRYVVVIESSKSLRDGVKYMVDYSIYSQYDDYKDSGPMLFDAAEVAVADDMWKHVPTKRKKGPPKRRKVAKKLQRVAKRG